MQCDLNSLSFCADSRLLTEKYTFGIKTAGLKFVIKKIYNDHENDIKKVLTPFKPPLPPPKKNVYLLINVT